MGPGTERKPPSYAIRSTQYAVIVLNPPANGQEVAQAGGIHSAYVWPAIFQRGVAVKSFVRGTVHGQGHGDPCALAGLAGNGDVSAMG